MTSSRSRFHAVFRHEQPDRTPLWDLEGVCEETVRLWCGQGFPTGRDVHEYIGYDGNVMLPISTLPIPCYPTTTVESDDRWVTYRDEHGFLVRRSREQAVTPIHYYYLDGSVQDRDDWKRLTRRYDPHDPRRLPLDWSVESVVALNTGDSPVALNAYWGPGRGPKNGYTLGMDRFLGTLHDDPGLLHLIFGFWADFLIELWRPIVSQVKIDYAVLNEDGLAHKTSSLIGPRMYRSLWRPYVKRVIDFLKSSGVSIVSFYTSGNIEPLLPELLDTGFNLFGPLEVASGMDAARLKREYGRDILLYGNISRQALMDGGEAVDREVLARIETMRAFGGYIPAVDDMILPDIPFAAFMRYVELVRNTRLG